MCEIDYYTLVHLLIKLFILGIDYNIPLGVEFGIKKMKKEEICKLCVPPNYAFGDTGNVELGIPPNASLVYEIELLSFSNVCYGYRTSVLIISVRK